LIIGDIAFVHPIITKISFKEYVYMYIYPRFVIYPGELHF